VTDKPTGQAACPIHMALNELGHKQPPTIIITNNACANGIANGTVRQKRSIAINMRFYWIWNRVRQGQLHINWKKGANNLTNYSTKHHPPAHHQPMHPQYLQQVDEQQQQNFAGNTIKVLDNSLPYKNNESTRENRIHCEGVLNNIGTQSHSPPINHPASTSVPLFLNTQAGPSTSPCSHA
jgi:hypothetical protein